MNFFKRTFQKPAQSSGAMKNTKAPGGVGPFAILWAAASGRLDGNPRLKKGLGFFLLLQLFALGLAIISGILGYARAVTFFSGTPSPTLFGLGTTIFIAASVYFFVNHVSSRFAFRVQGGIFDRGEMLALVVSFFLAGGIIYLDYNLNTAGIAPASHVLTQSARESNADGITSRYNSEIEQAEADFQANRKNFIWKGDFWVPDRGKSTKWHPKAQVEKYYLAEDRINQLKAAKIQELTNDGAVVQADFSRFTSEIGSKQDILIDVVNFLYFLMTLATFRAALYSNLVMDYLDANPYGDIPGDQTDRYGPRQKVDFSIPTRNGQKTGVESIGFKQGFLDNPEGESIPEKLDIPEKSGQDKKWSENGQNDTSQKVSSFESGQKPVLVKDSPVSRIKKMDIGKKVKRIDQKQVEKSGQKMSRRSGQKISLKSILTKAKEMRTLDIPITLQSLSSRVGASPKTIQRKLSSTGKSIKDLKKS